MNKSVNFQDSPTLGGNVPLVYKKGGEFQKPKEEDIIGSFLTETPLSTEDQEKYDEFSNNTQRLLFLRERKIRPIANAIRPLLRTSGPIHNIHLPQNSESIESFEIWITDRLQELGIYRKGLKIRVISSERIKQAIFTGSDRDNSSRTTDWNSGVDGEDIAMLENGLTPYQKSETTYVSDFDSWKNRVYRSVQGTAFLIYLPEALKAIGPNGTPLSNGFHMFLHPILKNPSLIAIIASQEDFRRAFTTLGIPKIVV